jgi:branched-chain amino acid transport system permease protein
MSYLPCGVYHEVYRQDHAFWQTKFVVGKMILLGVFIFFIIPYFGGLYAISVTNLIFYTIMGALGVQLLIGYCGQVTLGHAAFLAVGAYTSTLLMLQLHVPYLVSMLIAGLVAGVWGILFGLPSAKVKGFYLIMTSLAAQFVTVEFILTQYVSQIGGRGQAFSLPPGTITIGPLVIDTDTRVYYLGAILTILLTMGLANLLRSRVGRAWVAIRDNDIAAEAMGINIVTYKLMAYFVAGFIGGIAGAFWVSNLAALSPEHFQWFWSLWLVGVILIGGVGSIYGTIFGSLFMVLILEALKFIVIPLAPLYPAIGMKMMSLKDAVFGLAIVVFLIYEPNGLAYRWWQTKNYFNLWPFSY